MGLVGACCAGLAMGIAATNVAEVRPWVQLLTGGVLGAATAVPYLRVRRYPWEASSVAFNHSAGVLVAAVAVWCVAVPRARELICALFVGALVVGAITTLLARALARRPSEDYSDALDAPLLDLVYTARVVVPTVVLSALVVHGPLRGVLWILAGLWTLGAVAATGTDRWRRGWLRRVKEGLARPWSVVAAHEIEGEELTPRLCGLVPEPEGVLVWGERGGDGVYRADDRRQCMARVPWGSEQGARGEAVEKALRRPMLMTAATAMFYAGALALMAASGLLVVAETPFELKRLHPGNVWTQDPSPRVPGVELWRMQGPGWTRVYGYDRGRRAVLPQAELVRRAGGLSLREQAQLCVDGTNSSLGEVVLPGDPRLSVEQHSQVRSPERVDDTVEFWVLRDARSTVAEGRHQVFRARISRRTGTVAVQP